MIPRPGTCLIAAFFACGLVPLHAASADDYATRYDAFIGYTYLTTNYINLAQRGYHIQLGYNMKRWLAMGFDYSNVNGTLNLIPSYTPASIQAEIAPLLSVLPPTYKPSVPNRTNTQTYALGPSLVFRHFKRMAFLLHPSVGAVGEEATPYPADAITQYAVSLIITGKHLVNWKPFYGVGGGIDYSVTKHIGIRLHTDVVWDHLIGNIIGNGGWTVRMSVGPSFHFGKTL